MKLGTGLRNAMLGGSSLADALGGGTIQIYSGPVPNTADDAIGSTGANTRLCTISAAGTGAGLTFASPATGGVLTKNASEAWLGTNIAGGIATFFRHTLSGDVGTLDAGSVRIQGTVALNGADLNVSNTTLAFGASQSIDYYSISLPTA
jgi:hypothetical protein